MRIVKDCDSLNLTIHNPRNTSGIILSDDGERYEIEWCSGITNGLYYNHQIEYWYKQPLRELLEKIPRSDNSNYKPIDSLNLGYVDSLINVWDRPLEDFQSKQCRDIWEKYN